MTSSTKDLAAQFISLWQEQLAATLKDPESAMRMMQQWAAMQQATLNAMQTPHAPEKPAQPGQPVPGERQPSADEFARRLSECEARIAALEQELEARSREPA